MSTAQTILPKDRRDSGVGDVSNSPPDARKRLHSGNPDILHPDQVKEAGKDVLPNKDIKSLKWYVKM